ncbi:MAG: hypothetical protein ABJB47_12410 [Actinomycetota bacterium]
MADTRDCEQCATVFAPRREHARFCSPRCRVAWNRQHASGPAARNTGGRPTEVSALEWSIAAMREVTDRLPRVKSGERQRAFAVIGEAVWWVTIVDGTLVRHHPDAYDSVMAAQDLAERQVIEGILGGLRFVRNQIGHDVDHVDFICPAAGGPEASDRVTAWRWRPVPEPVLTSLGPRGQAWETSRYQAYEAYLQGHTTGEIFGQAAAFLTLAAASATAGVPG